MAEEVAIDLNIKTGEAEKNTQSLKSKLKDLKNQLTQMKEGTAEFNALAEEAGKLEDKIGDVNKRVKALASDTGKLDAFLSAAQGIAGGFAAAQGAAALFGVENEDLNKQLLKVQGSVALLNGVQQVANTLNKDSAISIKVLTFVQSRYNAVVEGTTGVLKAMRIAGAALGIGLIVTAVGLLIANFDKLVEGGKKLIARFEFLQKTVTALGDAYDYVIDKGRDLLSQFGLADSAIQHQTNLLKEAAIKDLERVVKAKEDEIKIRKAMGQDIYDLEQSLFDAQEELAKAKGESTVDIVAAQLTAIREKKEAERAAELKAEEEHQKALEKLKAEAAKRREEQQKIEDDIAKMQAEDRRQSEKDQAEQQQQILDEAKRHALEAQQAYENQLKIDAAKAKDRAAARVKLEQNVYNSLASIGNSLAVLGNKNAKLQKAFAIVQLAIDTAKSISAAVASVKLAVTPVDYALQVAAAIGVVIANIATAATLLGTKNPATGASSGANTAISSANDATQATAPQVPQTPQSIPIPQQVYVTETDISGVQGQVNVIEGLSKIG